MAGWSSLLEAFGVIPGTVQSCAAVLKRGDLLAIAPGGVYEAQLGDNRYELLWKQRLGFAKVAIEAQVVRFNLSNRVRLNTAVAFFFPPAADHSHLYSQHSRSFPLVQLVSFLLAVALFGHPSSLSTHLRRLPR